jgi:hypothetical protein
MTVPSKEVSWGIIRYAPGSGDFPEDDAASLDGWYTNREDALAVAKDRVSRHPQWVVGPVRSAVIWFGPGDFRRFETTPSPRVRRR